MNNDFCFWFCAFAMFGSCVSGAILERLLSPLMNLFSVPLLVVCTGGFFHSYLQMGVKR